MNTSDGATLVTLPRLVWLGVVTVSVCALVRFGCYGETRKVISNAGPLIVAIEKFKEKQGAYPDSLAALVPDLIRKIPGTGSFQFAAFEYSKDASITEFTGGYELRASIPFESGRYSDTGKALVYWPKGKYPSDPHGCGIAAEVSNGWAYYYSDSCEVPPAKELLRYPIN